jgi:cation transport ATPase
MVSAVKISTVNVSFTISDAILRIWHSFWLSTFHQFAQKAFIAQRQAYGQSVVYFGDCQRESVLAATADVAVTVADRHHRVNAEAPIVFLSPDLEKFSSLHLLCAKRNAQVKSAFAMATIPNVVAITAAVILNAPALVSVLMTTLGAATCYHRASRLLRQAAG